MMSARAHTAKSTVTMGDLETCEDGIGAGARDILVLVPRRGPQCTPDSPQALDPCASGPCYLWGSQGQHTEQNIGASGPLEEGCEGCTGD